MHGFKRGATFAASLAVSLALIVGLTAAPASAGSSFVHNCYTWISGGGNQSDWKAEGNWVIHGAISGKSETFETGSVALDNNCHYATGYTVEAGLIFQPIINGANQTICHIGGSGYQDAHATYANQCMDNDIWTEMRIYAVHRAWFSGTPYDSAPTGLISA